MAARSGSGGGARHRREGRERTRLVLGLLLRVALLMLHVGRTAADEGLAVTAVLLAEGRRALVLLLLGVRDVLAGHATSTSEAEKGEEDEDADG